MGCEPLETTIQIRDPDGNVLDLSTRSTAGEKSDYFNDPAGDRIQLVAFAPKA